MNRPDDIINALRRIQSRGLHEDEGDILHDILHGRSLMDEREKKVEAWKAFLAMDLDSMLKRATGLDNLEKFKRTRNQALMSVPSMRRPCIQAWTYTTPLRTEPQPLTSSE
jgi:hypothetical protein